MSRIEPYGEKTYRFEDVQVMRFSVYDVAGDFSSSDATHLNLDEQVH